MSLNGRTRFLRVGATLAAVLATGLVASAQKSPPPPFTSTTPYVLTAAIAPPAGVKITSFDISWVDPVRKRYYLANRTGKDIIVVDTTSNTVVSSFTPGFTGFTGSNDTSGPDGVLTSETTLWVGDAPSRVWALDPTTGAPVVSPISTSPTSPDRADEGCYDPVHKVVAFVNNADSPPFLTFISTTTFSVLSQIVFDGAGGAGHGPMATNGAEQCQFNPRDQRIYLSIPEINGDGTNNFAGGVVVIDPSTRQVVTTLGIGGIAPGTALTSTSPCTAPQGLAIGPAPQLGLGCNIGGTNTGGATNNAIIQDMTGSSPGALVASFPGQGGCDEAWYNPGNNKYSVACRSANPGPAAVFVIDAGSFAVQRLFSGNASNAHSVASDPSNFNIYVPVSSASTSGLCSSKGAVDANGCILVFAPQSQPAVATHDFNHDFKSDILWRNLSTGDVVMWLMNGFTIQSNLSAGTVTTDWAIVGQRDFNGDGFADILWRNGTTGQAAIWLMNSNTMLPGSGSIGTVTTDWFVAGTGDFNGDGRGDILWRNTTTGAVAMWFMNGTTVLSATELGVVTTDWIVASVADLNGDGFSDVLWRNTVTGQLAVWFMNGATIQPGSGSIGTVTTDWTVAGTGDFNGDGKWDIVWRQTGGNVAIWLMNGTTVVTAAGLGNVATSWSINETGDVNADGKSDIIWSDTGGNVAIWEMTGTSILAAQVVGAMPTPPWQVQGMNAD
jgi:hypothetical protein